MQIAGKPTRNWQQVMMQLISQVGEPSIAIYIGFVALISVALGFIDLLRIPIWMTGIFYCR